MLRRIFALLLALVIVLLVVGFLLPSTVTVQRDRIMDHPPEVIFEVLSDLRHFVEWTPWLDQAAGEPYRLEGPPAGQGATLIWREGRDAGANRMRITATEPDRRIEFSLELGDNEARGHFLLEPEGLGQRVRWGLTLEFGALDLVGRYVGLMLPGLVGREYEQGLESLEAYLDQAPGRVPGLPADTDERTGT